MRSYFARHYAHGDTDTRPFLARYGIVVVSVAAAYILTQLLPSVHQFTPFLFYILAVLAVTVYGGVGPGVLAAVCAVLIVPGWAPAGEGLLPLSTPYLFHTTAFVVIAAIILLLSYALGATRGRLSSARAQSAAASTLPANSARPHQRRHLRRRPRAADPRVEPRRRGTLWLDSTGSRRAACHRNRAHPRDARTKTGDPGCRSTPVRVAAFRLYIPLGPAQQSMLTRRQRPCVALTANRSAMSSSTAI